MDMVKDNRGVDIDIDNLPLQDPGVYKMIGEGKTVGVFQLESAGMTSFMKELKPGSLEDIIAGISLDRPGPMAEISRDIGRRTIGKSLLIFVRQLEPILSVTYWCHCLPGCDAFSIEKIEQTCKVMLADKLTNTTGLN